MSPTINELYKIEQFEYFKKLGYFTFSLEKNNKFNSSKTFIFYISKNLESIKNEVFDCYSMIETKENLLKNMTVYDRINLDDKLSKEFFLFFLNKYPKFKKQTITSLYWLNSLQMKDLYKDIIEQEKYITIETFIKKFNTIFPIKEFTIYTDSFENIHNYLSKSWSNDEIHLFWIDFFKQRKSILKSVKEAPKIANFLIEKYEDYEKLKLFFPFFPFLHAKFEDLEPDIFDKKTKHIDYIPIQYKKIGDVFNIKGFKREQYSNHVISLMNVISEKYNVDLFEHVGKNKSSGNYYLTFYHNNELFDIEYVKKNLISYFTYLKHNPEEKPNKDFIKKWLFTQDLNGELINKNNEIKKNKQKI